MEDGYAAQVAAVPFGLVLGEFRVDRFQEWAHKRDFIGRADNCTLEVVVFDLKKGKNHVSSYFHLETRRSDKVDWYNFFKSRMQRMTHTLIINDSSNEQRQKKLPDREAI